jgi:hypothetical protein
MAQRYRTPRVANLYHAPPRTGPWLARVPVTMLARYVARYRRLFGTEPEIEYLRPTAPYRKRKSAPADEGDGAA